MGPNACFWLPLALKQTSVYTIQPTWVAYLHPNFWSKMVVPWDGDKTMGYITFCCIEPLRSDIFWGALFFPSPPNIARKHCQISFFLPYFPFFLALFPIGLQLHSCWVGGWFSLNGDDSYDHSKALGMTLRLERSPSIAANLNTRNPFMGLLVKQCNLENIRCLCVNSFLGSASLILH